MKLSTLLRKFSKDKKGSTAIGLGLTFTMVTGATIGAIEIEQMQKTRNIMQDKLDATILYLGNSEHKTTPQDAGEAYFRATIESTDIDLISMNPTFRFDDATGEIIGDVDFEIQGLMTGGLIKDKSLAIRAIATPKTTGTVEISMVLDVSGSMGWSFSSNSSAPTGQRRIDGLFEAANEMFDVIYQNPQAVPSVAVIPYATSVDITDLFAATTVSERTQGFVPFNDNLNSLDDVRMIHTNTSTPSLLNLTSDDVKLRDHADTMTVYAAERFQSDNGEGDYTVSIAKPEAGTVMPVYTESDSSIYTSRSGVRKISGNGRRWYFGGTEKPYMGVLPMTKDIDTVRDYVANFTPSGGTAGHIGAAWGLYALTPAWNSTFDHPAGAPQQFADTTEKYLVIMTDGQFNSQKTPGMSTADMYGYFQSVCTKAREKGVRVFTVGLLLDDNTEKQLTQCSDASGAFYSVDNRLQLVEAFKSIGRETGELRLSH